jgi:hypothetical protein
MLEEGHLPWLGVGHTLLTFQQLVTILGCWERGGECLKIGAFSVSPTPSLDPVLTVLSIYALPQSLKKSLHACNPRYSGGVD